MRTSPSGSGVYTDLQGAAFQASDLTIAGSYILVPEENFVGSLVLMPVIDPFDDPTVQQAMMIAHGAQTRRGKIGRTRAVYGVNSGGGVNTARRKPTTFQWVVYDLATKKFNLVGEVVTLPWGPILPGPVPPITDLANEPINFGSVKWASGGAFALVVTVGAKIDPGTAGDGNFLIMNEVVGEPLSPVPGPEGP